MRLVSIDLSGRRLMLFHFLENCEDGLIVDGEHDVDCLDVYMRNERSTCCALKRKANRISNVVV